MTREEAKAGMNVVKYGMSYDTSGSGSFSGHEDFIDKIYDDFESRICKSCKQWHIKQFCMLLDVDDIKGCGLWEKIDD